jgi:glutaredoxin
MKKITVFTTTTCAYCGMVKKWLDSKQYKYTTINLDENPEMQKDIFQKSGSLTVPVTLIEEGDVERVVIGFNLSGLSSALA